MGVEIVRVTSEMFEEVYPLLEDFKNPNLNKSGWHRLFSPPWKNREGYCGYALYAKEGHTKGIVGFLGTVYGKRVINDEMQCLCNLSSWIVKPEYRNSSLSLLMPVLRQKECIITNFTASNDVARVLLKLGFMGYPASWRLFVPGVSGRHPSWSVTDRVGEHIDILNAEDRQIFLDHQELPVIHTLVYSPDAEDYCYLIANRPVLKRIPFSRIHYISNISIFMRYMKMIERHICLRQRTLSVIVDQRLLNNGNMQVGYKFNPGIWNLYRPGNKMIRFDDIDNLYSEIVLLGY